MTSRPRRRHVLWISVLVVLTMFSRPPDTAQSLSYTIRDVGTLGGARSVGLGLNNAGDVVGYSESGDGSRHAFVFRGTTVDLGTLGGRESIANRISDSGLIVGRSQTESGDEHAFIAGAGGLVDLGSADPRLAEGFSTATGVNGLGTVVGYRRTGADHMAARSRIFRLSDGQLVDLGTFGAADAVASAINEAGQVAGFYSTEPHGDYANHRAFVTVGDKAVELGNLGGRVTTATDINRAGVVVGFGQTRSGEPHAFVYAAGAIRDLGTLAGGHQSFAYGVNDRGDVVGASSSSDGTLHAFISRNGTLTDLNTVIPSGSGWILTEARDINNAGHIVGTGVFNGQQRAFLLLAR